MAETLAPKAPGSEPRYVVFFDGVCGLCSHIIDFLLARDHQHLLRFTPLQGAYAQRTLSAAQRTDLNTMVFMADSRAIYERSDAALRATALLGGGWRGASLLLAIPRPLRDFCYNFVARHRYRIFGRKDSCRLPTPAERAYFLD